MKHFILNVILFLSCSFTNAAIFRIVVAQNPPDLSTICPGDTLRFSGDSLNQNVYGTIACYINNADSLLNSFCAVSSFTNVQTTCDHILVSGDYYYAFTPSVLGFGFLTFNCPTTLGADIPIPGLRVVPNPVSDYLDISSELFPIHCISIYDIDGKRIIKRDMFQYRIIIDVADLTPGFYFIQLDTEQKTIFRKVIKY